MKNIPKTEHPLVLRTDFSDNSAWESICAAIQMGEFPADVECLSDSEYDGLTIEHVTDLCPKFPDFGAPEYDGLTVEHVGSLLNGYPGYPGCFCFIFIVDQIALTHPDHPILVLNLQDEPGRTFRVIPSEMCSIAGNLRIGNLDFCDFADNVDKHGIFRGFPPR
jgi:hypothetical protein